MPADRSPVAAWGLILAVTAVASLSFALLALPSPVLFGALLGGMVHALTSSRALGVPVLAFRVGQALIGITIGSMVSLEALARMRSDLLPIVMVTLGTLVASLAAGWLFARRRDVSGVTGVFSLIAGGASGVVAVAHELGADDRVVTVVQYLRVLLVLVAMPLVTTAVFHPERGVGTLGQGDAPWPTDLAYVAVALVVGLLVARFSGVPTATLLGPLAVAVALSVGGWFGFDQAAVPLLLQWLAYLLIGVQVGLRFTRASLAAITPDAARGPRADRRADRAVRRVRRAAHPHDRGRRPHGVPRHDPGRAVRGAGHRGGQRVRRHLRDGGADLPAAGDPAAHATVGELAA
jgi:uncharacterized protein